MHPPHDHSQLASVLLAQELTGSTFSDESVTQPGPSLSIDDGAGDAYFLLDVVVDRLGRPRLIEANGSNAAGSSARQHDLPRVEHLVASVLARPGPDRPPLVILGHQRGTPCLPEILTRAGLVASRLAEVSGAAVELMPAGARLADGATSVVTGPIDEFVHHLSVSAGRLHYLGAPVTLASNANLVPALARRGILDLDLAVFHEGRAAAVVLDKAAQQAWTSEAGIAPIATIEADTVDEAVELVARKTVAWFVKMRSGSGGTGVVCIPPGSHPNDTKRLISIALEGAEDKYGNLSTAFPLGCFEFADTAPALIDGQPYLWDLRVEVLVSADRVVATPLSARRCPLPFDGSYGEATVVVNLSGREDGNTRVLAPADLVGALPLQKPDVGDVLAMLTMSSARWGLAVAKAFT